MFTFLIQEVRLFFIGVWFLTRLPIPKWVGFQESWLEECAKYFPLVGSMIGTIGFITFYALQFFVSPIVAFVCSIGILVILTGSFHEDGFADFCDGIGGGWNKEDILRIMKDSRVGSFGVMGLLLLFAVRILGGGESFEVWKDTQSPFYPILVLKTWLLFITAHSFSRWVSVGFLYWGEYAREDGYAKPMAKSLNLNEYLYSSIFGLLPFFTLVYFSPWFASVLIPVFFIRLYMNHLMVKWIGGFTGDGLGAVQQAVETALWVAGVFLWI